MAERDPADIKIIGLARLSKTSWFVNGEQIE